VTAALGVARTARIDAIMAGTLAAENEARFWSGVEQARRFFMGEADVVRALERLAGMLDELGIPYAVVGGMALNEWGFQRVTVGVDVLLTADGLRRLRERALGRGYAEKFPGSRGLRDLEAGVDIDVLVAGEYPGDGKPKPVAFPDPAAAAVRGRRVALLPLEQLVELKLASGTSSAHRLRDLADVLDLIRVLRLPRELASRLDLSVRPKYEELWLTPSSSRGRVAGPEAPTLLTELLLPSTARPRARRPPAPRRGGAPGT
jgi:hypothetical protein